MYVCIYRERERERERPETPQHTPQPKSDLNDAALVAMRELHEGVPLLLQLPLPQCIHHRHERRTRALQLICIIIILISLYIDMFPILMFIDICTYTCIHICENTRSNLDDAALVTMGELHEGVPLLGQLALPEPRGRFPLWDFDLL